MDLRNYIEHTLLKSGTTETEILRHVQEANTHQFLGVCLNPYWIPLAKRHLAKSVKLVTVIGFPLGAELIKTKIRQAYEVAAAGVDEVDMVANIDAIKSGHWDFVAQEIADIKRQIHPLPLKVIVETHLLTKEEKVQVTKIIVESGADFIKTSTGFTGGGATIEDVVLFKEVAGHLGLKIKASGGIRTREQAIQLVQAGAHRLGTSRGVDLVLGTQSSQSTY